MLILFVVLLVIFLALITIEYRKRYHISPSENKKNVLVLYGSQGGRGKRLALLYGSNLSIRNDIAVEFKDISDCDPETLPNLAMNTRIIIFLSTYIDGRPPPGCEWFCDYLIDAASDFRFDKNHLSNLLFAVIGMGDSAYSKQVYNKPAKQLDKALGMLGATRVMSATLIDHSIETRTEEKMAIELMTSTLHSIHMNAGDVSEFKEVSEIPENSTTLRNRKERPIPKARKSSGLSNGVPKAMVTPMIKENLTKQGYKVIGSHSGVKLCRWTKAMLRGRGGCYKHTFYGIESHRCMEATPSLACANKCVFCWRHHTNPVGTEWKWLMDEPDDIVNGAINKHVEMIRTLRGVPGVKPDRFEEAHHVRHCALSLVGEPIMYPKISALMSMLHEKRISTFLVTNAQFPQAIRDLVPATQLYVSIDAADRESLRKIDRPLFSDFWERFLESIDALAIKKQRTVFRLTLVKSYNMEQLQGYAALIQRGKPSFIEIKGVTYCGEPEKGQAKLTMKNVPWHNEVVSFAQELVKLVNPDYSIAAEHAHSNSVLIAHEKFRIDGEWHTWIDYEKFHDLMAEGKRDFDAVEYASPTPYWACFGASEKGFDPNDERYYRKSSSKPKDMSGC